MKCIHTSADLRENFWGCSPKVRGCNIKVGCPPVKTKQHLVKTKQKHPLAWIINIKVMIANFRIQKCTWMSSKRLKLKFYTQISSKYNKFIIFTLK